MPEVAANGNGDAFLTDGLVDGTMNEAFGKEVVVGILEGADDEHGFEQTEYPFRLITGIRCRLGR